MIVMIHYDKQMKKQRKSGLWWNNSLYVLVFLTTKSIYAYMPGVLEPHTLPSTARGKTLLQVHESPAHILTGAWCQRALYFRREGSILLALGLPILSELLTMSKEPSRERIIPEANRSTLLSSIAIHCLLFGFPSLRSSIPNSFLNHETWVRTSSSTQC